MDHRLAECDYTVTLSLGGQSSHLFWQRQLPTSRPARTNPLHLLFQEGKGHGLLLSGSLDRCNPFDGEDGKAVLPQGLPGSPGLGNCFRQKALTFSGGPHQLAIPESTLGREVGKIGRMGYTLGLLARKMVQVPAIMLSAKMDA